MFLFEYKLYCIIYIFFCLIVLVKSFWCRLKKKGNKKIYEKWCDDVYKFCLSWNWKFLELVNVLICIYYGYVNIYVILYN